MKRAQQLLQIGEQINSANNNARRVVAELLPIGTRISVTLCGRRITGVVDMHRGAGTDVRIRNEATDKPRWINAVSRLIALEVHTPPVEQPQQYCYSVDEETYHGRFDSAEEAALEGFESYDDAGSLWVGELAPHTAHRFVGIDRLLEDCGERAYDECGEGAAEDWPALDRDQGAELEQLIGDFLQQHSPPTFYGVTDVRTFQRADVGLGPCPGDEA